MRTGRFLILFLVLFGLTGLSVLIGNRQNYSGDLTRIGALPDQRFRASKADVAIPANSQVNSPIETADVIVVGDSFSVALQWQSILVEAGLKVHTIHWTTLERQNLSPQAWLRQSKARPDAVLVLQIIERSIASQTDFLDKVVPEMSVADTVQHMDTAKPARDDKRHEGDGGKQRDEHTAASADTSSNPLENAAANSSANPASKQAGEQSGQGQQAPHALQNINNRMSTGMRLLYNHIRLSQNKDFVAQYPGAPSGTRVSPFKDGCRYFSHSDCTRLLTLAADEKSQRFDAIYRRKVEGLNARMQAMESRKVLWLIVPNKTSVYRLPPTDMAELDFTPIERNGDAGAVSATGPNMFRYFAGQRETLMDLYSPDDTHLSNEGSRLMGQEMHRYLMVRQP